MLDEQSEHVAMQKGSYIIYHARSHEFSIEFKGQAIRWPDGEEKIFIPYSSVKNAGVIARMLAGAAGCHWVQYIGGRSDRRKKFFRVT